MAFGIYIHIPHCPKVCPYCDFTKYESGKIMPPEKYVELLVDEIRLRSVDVPKHEVSTIYFGGGTPSLFDPPLILAILDELAKAGFRPAQDAEITIEINPSTLDQSKLDAYRAMGINRFSVGAQTFNDRLLKVAGRQHTARETVETLSLLQNNGVNYSFDLLFALPSQTLEELRADIKTALMFDPSHLSSYCLTVPDQHPMSRGRASEEDQVEMFRVVESTLDQANLKLYEISNFARPGFESRHNMLYWSDQPYWGIGVGAHSYFPRGFSPSIDAQSEWGARFWNLPALNLHEKQIRLSVKNHASPFAFAEDLPDNQKELLRKHQSLTDFCHTSLRLVRGLDMNALRLKFGETTEKKVESILANLEASGRVERTATGWTLTETGRVVSNAVYEDLTFLEGEEG